MSVRIYCKNNKPVRGGDNMNAQIYYKNDELIATVSEKLIVATHREYIIDRKRYTPAKAIIEKCPELSMRIVDSGTSIITVDELQNDNEIILFGKKIVKSITEDKITLKEIFPFQVSKSKLFYVFGDNGFIVCAVTPRFRRLWVYGDQVATPEKCWNKVIPPISRLFSHCPVEFSFSIKRDRTEYKLTSSVIPVNYQKLHYFEIDNMKKVFQYRIYTIE